MTENNETHIFDDVFRTMEEHTPELMLPLINEVFKTNYPENTKITRLADKRHLLRQADRDSWERKSTGLFRTA